MLTIFITMLRILCYYYVCTSTLENSVYITHTHKNVMVVHYNIIPRPDRDKMEEHLKSLGADEVVTEETSQSRNMAPILEVHTCTCIIILKLQLLVCLFARV